MNHIYIIEDDSVLCSELALPLEAVGYHTTCANDFNNVLNEFLLGSPDTDCDQTLILYHAVSPQNASYFRIIMIL